MSEKPLIDTKDFSLSHPVLFSDQTAHEPDITVDSQGQPIGIWSERSNSGDQIKLQHLVGNRQPITLSNAKGVECQPTVVTTPNDEIVSAWIARRNDCWHLITRSVIQGQKSTEIILASSSEGVFRPRLLNIDHVIWIVYEWVAEQKSTIAWLRRENDVWSKPTRLELGNGDYFRPELTNSPDGSIQITTDRYLHGKYSIVTVALNHTVNPIDLTVRINRCCQSNIIAAEDSGYWITYASVEGNPAEDPWWLTKYASLIYFDGESVFEPNEPMPARDLTNEDSFQGWEFPALATDAYNRVWLFGQASHTLYAQYFAKSGWSERFTIAPKRWGSWKPRCRTAGNGPIYLVSMGLGGAQMQRLDSKPPENRPHGDWPIRPVSRLTAGAPKSVRVEFPTAASRQGSDRLYFGDLHAHSIYGDATGDVDEFYYRYRDAYGYDFATLTEHDYLDGMQLSASELAMMWAAADRMSVDGKFIALYGYEWTSPALADHAGKSGSVGEGHRHIIYPDKNGPLESYGEKSSNTGEKLLQRLKGQRALVIPHHTSWSGTDLDAYDPNLSRLIEIVSTHGRFEYPGNLPIGYRRDHVHSGKYVVDALARGHRVGFVGGSDSHGLRWHATEMEGRASHIPAGTRVGWKEDAYRTGMTGVIASELTREALFEALYERRCYATSGVPIVLDVRIADQMMGSEIQIDRVPTIQVSVEGTAPIRSIEFVRNGYAFARHRVEPPDGLGRIEFEMTDQLLIPGETQYYYVRVIQEDGNMAWSSPIWVTFR